MKEIHVGDYIRTPRFMTVKIEEVFSDAKSAHAAGYNIPTYYKNNGWLIGGKQINEEQMEFAAYLE